MAETGENRGIGPYECEIYSCHVVASKQVNRLGWHPHMLLTSCLLSCAPHGQDCLLGRALDDLQRLLGRSLHILH